MYETDDVRFCVVSRHTYARPVVVDRSAYSTLFIEKLLLCASAAIITNNYAYVLRLLLFPDSAVYSCSLSVKRSYTVILLQTSIIGYIVCTLRVYFR